MTDMNAHCLTVQKCCIVKTGKHSSEYNHGIHKYKVTEEWHSSTRIHGITAGMV